MKEKICGYYLDQQQEAIVIDDSNYLLVVAGAGSGKTFTILGKVKYLIKYKNILPDEILCISFTKASANSLKQKIKNELKIDIPVYTFHKLSLNILNESNMMFSITQTDLLDIIIDDFFDNYILNYEYHMKLVLKYFKVLIHSNTKKCYLEFKKNNENNIKVLKRLIITFIHLFKCNNYNLEDFNKFLYLSKKTSLNFNYSQEKILLTLILNIYNIYQNYLYDNNEIDFDDMIVKATSCVKNNNLDLGVKYIIIDEYQDTSLVRFALIKEIIDKTNSKLMVVGDDFQSIYRFTGCELSLFINFKNYFPTAKIKKIENTYRNSQELITVAGDFVMKNPIQIKKKLTSTKYINKPIEVIFYKNKKQDFTRLVLNIYNKTKKAILVLGRNNKDINNVLDENWLLVDDKIIYKNNVNISIYFLTIHKSKGLEDENVIIINLTNNLLGFPSKIRNNKILRFVSTNKEIYPFSEERRLFYVALTRTKNKVYLFTPIKGKSVFVSELMCNYRKYIEVYKY